MRTSPLASLIVSLGFLAALPIADPAVAQDASQEARFTNVTVANDADRYEAYLKANWRAGKRSISELTGAGQKLLGLDPRGASRLFAEAVVSGPKSVQAWLGLAQALLAIKPDANKGSERYDLPVNASGAAYRAYKYAGDDRSKARALAVLGNALKRRSFWRPALNAFKVSLALHESPRVRGIYQRLRAVRGFRMVNYKPDAEARPPRVCLSFSESLPRGTADLAKYVSVDGQDAQGVQAKGRQLCVEGFEHGKRYEVRLRAGLPSVVGEALLKPIELGVYMPDRKPSVRFSGRAYVLPSTGQQGIPIVSVNTKSISVEVYRIGDRGLVDTIANGDLYRQMSNWDVETLKKRTGERVYSGTLDVKSKLNEDVTSAFPVSEAIGTMKPGAYAVVAKPAGPQRGYQDAVATQWFIVSDLGLTAFTGEDGVHAFVRSLSSAQPVANTKVRLIARNNEVLGVGETDAKGYARFSAGLARGEGGMQPALLVAEDGAGAYAFLDLAAGAFDLSDRGVEGRKPPGPIDGYLYTDRGVYRPGEDVNLTALLRARAGIAVALPATLIIKRPDGVEHRRRTLKDQGLGGRIDLLQLGDGAMTGTWRAQLHADPKADAIAQASFLVEDFVPERLDMELSSPDTTVSIGRPATVEAKGRYLYGPPASGLALEGDIVVRRATFDAAGLKGFKFGLADETITPVRDTLSALPKTGDDGKAAFSIRLPRVQKTAQPLEAKVMLRLAETGGRTIERALTLPVSLGISRIGIKPLFGGDTTGEGETAKFEVIYLDTRGKRVEAKGFNWSLERLETSWQWYSRGGYWSYDSITIPTKVANGTLDLEASKNGSISVPVDYGRYRLQVASSDVTGPVSSYDFTAGWYASGDMADSPEVLDVALDKASYKPGEVAKLRIATKYAGKAVIAVLGTGVHALHEVEIAKGGGDVDVDVGSDWGAGAYVTALFYRPMDQAAKRMPGRAIGVQWLALDQSARTLSVDLGAPSKIKSGSELKLPVKVAGLKAGEDARITIAAVDVGVLNLTRYSAPAPDKWFYAQRRLGLEIRDFYGRLIDGMRAERGSLRSGGGGDPGLRAQGSPPVEETVSLFSGIVKVGADGTANVAFDLPDFNGTVRLMAAAWSGDKLGHATKDVIVREKIALTASGPRFLTLGDEVTLALAMHNVEGPKATYKLSVMQQVGDAQAQSFDKRAVNLEVGKRKTEKLTFKPTAVGLHTFDVRITGPDDIDVTRQLKFDVRPPSGDIKRTTVATIKPNGGKLTLSADLVQDLIASRSRVMLSAGPSARFDVPGLLTQLDRYPYGCAEQTVSRALPLVYANAVASRLGIADDKALRKRVQKAVDRVFEMQDASGAFGSWGPSYTNMWLSAYVTDFLTRAKEAGFSVKPKAFAQALDRLQNFVAYAQDFKQGGEERAYALYVLARNARAPIGELRYLSDARLDRFSTPLAKAQLGAALAMMGDKSRSENAFRAALSDIEKPQPATSRVRHDYGSRLRDGAAIVTLTSESGIAGLNSPRLVDVVAGAYKARNYTSTQEQAWMLLAANALGERTAGANLTVNGEPLDGSLVRRIAAADLVGSDVVIQNNGSEPIETVVSVVGAGLKPEPAMAKGFAIERSYYTLDGKKLELASVTGGIAEVDQNQRLVAVVKLDVIEQGGRVLLVDRLPAGFEIENPRLVDSGNVESLSWLTTNTYPEHTEFRDDRFVAAFNFLGDRGHARPKTWKPKSVTVAYIVRAVTPGRYVHLAATAEDMYAPERHARTAAGTLVVKARD